MQTLMKAVTARKKNSFFNEFNQVAANGNTKWQILFFLQKLQHFF